MKSNPITLRLEPDTEKLTRKHAKKEGISISTVGERALNHYLTVGPGKKK